MSSGPSGGARAALAASIDLEAAGRMLRLLVAPGLPADPLERRDPEAIAATASVLGAWLDLWFAPEVRGFDGVPEGPALLVGSHNGGLAAPDMFCLMVAGWRYFGPAAPAYGLAHDQVLTAPGLGWALARLGAVPASPSNAVTLLERGARVLVYPGGDVDVFRPYSERHRIKLAGRRGFARVALRAGAPIVPVVSVGAHETIRVLSDGRGLARAIGLKRWTRVEVLPVFACLPWGLWVGPAETHLPVPSQIRIRLLPPVPVARDPEAADDEERVAALATEVERRMQAGLDELAAEPGYGVRARLRALLEAARGP